jgi:hypothetical protein
VSIRISVVSATRRALPDRHPMRVKAGAPLLHETTE